MDKDGEQIKHQPMRSEDKNWTITVTDSSCFIKISPDDLSITVTRNSLRQLILEILKEKGLLQEDNQ